MSLDFLAGCLGGCAGVAVGHPLDTVKVRLQTQDPFNPKYRGTWHCLSDTLKKESFRGLYKGMSSPMAGVAFINAIVFGVQGNIVRRCEDRESLKTHFLAGASAGFVQSFIASPMELVKTRTQIVTELSHVTPQSPLECATTILKTEGLRGIFRGQMITTMREIPGLGSYFLSYQYITQQCGGSAEASPLVVLGAGGLAGICSWLITYPIDVIKSRLQIDGMNGVTKYKGIIHCLKTSVQTEGLKCLTRGLNSTIIRAFPTNAATFAVFTFAMRLLDSNINEEHVENIWDNLKVGETLPMSNQYKTKLTSSNLSLYQQQIESLKNLSYSSNVLPCLLNHEFDYTNEMKKSLNLYEIGEVAINSMQNNQTLTESKSNKEQKLHQLTSENSTVEPSSPTPNRSNQQQSNSQKDLSLTDRCKIYVNKGSEMLYRSTAYRCPLTISHQILSNNL